MKVITIDPMEVKVRGGLDRLRKDVGKVQDLAQSIKTDTQLVPILVTKDLELIDGGRRLAACIFAGVKVKAVIREDLSTDLQLRTAEIVTNVQRKAFTPAEEQLAIAELHRIKCQQAGVDPNKKSTGGQGKAAWNMQETAKLLNCSTATVSNALTAASVIKQNPELKKAKTVGTILNAAKKAAVLTNAATVVKANKEKLKSTIFRVKKQTAEEFFSETETASVDLCITDPPWGIDVQTLRHIKCESVDSYNDTETDPFLLTNFASELHRVLRPTGQVYIFGGTELVTKLRDILTAANFEVYWKELIWIKTGQGQGTRTEMWPIDAYEKILFARKPDSRLVKEGLVNWIQCERIRGAHQAEKPVKLIENLLLRSALPGQVLIDPYCGSGAILEAGLNYKLFVAGCDISEEFINLTLSRLVKYEMS